MTTTPRRARREAPIVVFAQSPDDPLDADQAAAFLAIHEDSPWKLEEVPSYLVPGVGRRWRRGDLIAYLYRPEHRKAPKSERTCQAKAPRARGTRRAKDAPADAIPGTTDTEAQLRERNGYK